MLHLQTYSTCSILTLEYLKRLFRILTATDQADVIGKGNHCDVGSTVTCALERLL